MRPIDRLAIVCASAATFFAASQTAVTRADPIRYEFGGVITSADPSTGVTAGTRFDGEFTYDSAAPVVDPLASTEGQIGYGNFTGASGMILNVGGQQVFDVNSLGLVVDYGPKYSQTPTAQDPAMTKLIIEGMTDQAGVSLTLTNPSRSVFPPYPLPTSILAPSDFPQAQLLVIDRETGSAGTLFSGTIDTLILTPVPEPGTLASVFVIIAALALRERLKRSDRTRRR
jgi:hypothetical protein